MKKITEDLTRDLVNVCEWRDIWGNASKTKTILVSMSCAMHTLSSPCMTHNNRIFSTLYLGHILWLLYSTDLFLIFHYWLKCSEGVWWPWCIGSEIWFQDDFWETSLLGFKKHFCTSLLKDFVSWGSDGDYSMHDRSLPGRRFGVFVLSVL